MEETHYYHHSDYEISIGTLLEPRLRETMRRWPHYDRLVEIIFERVRREEFPDIPSRLESVFVTPNKDTYHSRQYHYEVRCSGQMFDTDQDIWSEAVLSQHSVTKLEDFARRYWGGTNNAKTPETLVKGEVVVVNKV